MVRIGTILVGSATRRRARCQFGPQPRATVRCKAMTPLALARQIAGALTPIEAVRPHPQRRSVPSDP
jgi:hypothetical protein